MYDPTLRLSHYPHHAVSFEKLYIIKTEEYPTFVGNNSEAKLKYTMRRVALATETFF